MERELDLILEEYEEGNMTLVTLKAKLLPLFSVSTPLHFTKNEVDFAYCAGVFNIGEIDKLSDELNRLKELKKEPSDIILAARNGG